MARRPRNQACPSDSASGPAPPAAASSGKTDDGKSPSRPVADGQVSPEVEAQFKGYLQAALKAEEEARANKPKYTGWDSPPSSPKTKASSVATTAGNKGKGKQAAKKPEADQKYGAEKWLALPAGVRLADAFEPPKALTAPATPKVEQQKGKPIASGSKMNPGTSQSAGDLKGPTVPLSGPKTPQVPVTVTAVPAAPVAKKPVPPQLRLKCQPSSKLKKEPRVVDSVVHLPIEMEDVVNHLPVEVEGVADHLPAEMEDVVYHKNPKIEYREFDGDVVMQDLFEAPLEVPKKLDQVLGQRKFKRPSSKQKSKISARVIRMAEEEIKRMRKSL